MQAMTLMTAADPGHSWCVHVEDIGDLLWIEDPLHPDGVITVPDGIRAPMVEILAGYLTRSPGSPYRTGAVPRSALNDALNRLGIRSDGQRGE